MKARGSITQLPENQCAGYILGEDGCLVKFDEASFDRAEIQKVAVGDWVEYDELEAAQGGESSRLARWEGRRGEGAEGAGR
jgi:hypothetical protein